MMSALSRLRNPARIGYLAMLGAEAVMQITLVWLKIRLAPSGNWRRWLEPRPGLAEPSPHLARDLRRIVGLLAPVLPRRTRCLICAMAARAMLARRGFGSTLSLGADISKPALAAHAWLSAGTVIVTGRENMTAYREVARF